MIRRRWQQLRTRVTVAGSIDGAAGIVEGGAAMTGQVVDGGVVEAVGDLLVLGGGGNWRAGGGAAGMLAVELPPLREYGCTAEDAVRLQRLLRYDKDIEVRSIGYCSITTSCSVRYTWLCCLQPFMGVV